jgi:hypothetical protein
VLGTRLVRLEGGGEREDRLPVLDRDDPAGGERAAVADAVDLVEDRHRRVARPEEIRVQRVDDAARGGAARGDERLPRDLPADHALAVLLRAPSAEDVHLELLEIEELDQSVVGRRHAPLSSSACPRSRR